ncbi:MAG: cache domain-containing protein, partial [Candidatus Neomarinimicrobiota bacterium]
RELSAAAATGGGFVEFYWVKPGATGEKRKLGYVEPIKNTDYFIGTGVYME